MKVLQKIEYIVFIIMVLILSIFIARISIKNHYVKYTINSYKIEEKYIKKYNNKYEFLIQKNDKNYYFSINNDLNKSRKIINNINSYKKNNLECIIPEFKNEKIKKEIYCILDKTQVSKDYLIKTNNKDFKKIKKSLKETEITNLKESNKIKEYKKIKIYNENITDTENIILWNYKEIYSIRKNKINHKKIVKKDLYDNIMAEINDTYYVLFDNKNVDGIDNIYLYNYNKNKIKKVKLKEKISKDSYINGVYENNIYITDNKEKKEYIFDIKKKCLKNIDKNQTEYIVYENGTKKILSKSDYFMKKQLFNDDYTTNNKITIQENLKKYDDDYFYLENNKFYKVNENYNDQKILLFELNNIKEWYVRENKIYILSDDIIYSYENSDGLRKLIEYNELRYNYQNIYKIGKNR